MRRRREGFRGVFINSEVDCGGNGVNEECCKLHSEDPLSLL